MAEQTPHHGATHACTDGNSHLAGQLVVAVQPLPKRGGLFQRGFLQQRHSFRTWTKSRSEAKKSVCMVIIGIDLQWLDS
jgi:hypothetical protein